MRTLFVTVCVALGLAGSAQATVLSGALAGVKVPAQKTGVAVVRAVDLATAVIGDAASLSRSGAFRLDVAPGTYVLFGAVSRLGGSAATETRPLQVRLTTTGKRKLKVRAKKKKKKKRPAAHATARPGFVDVDYPAIWVKHFDTSRASDEWQIMGKGLADIIITDLIALAPPGCPTAPKVVEREKLGEVLKELALQQSDAIDPATRQPTGHLVEHNMIVTGAIITSGSRITITAKVSNLRTGRSFSTKVTGARETFLDMEEQLVAKISPFICTPPATCPQRQVCPGPGGDDTPTPDHPARYEGTVSGTQTVQTATLSWNGTVTLTYQSRHGGGQGGAPPGDYWYFNASAGTLHVTLSGTSGGCTLTGQADVPAVGQYAGSQISVQADSAAPAYFITGQFGASDAVPYTKSGGPDCTGGGNFPLAGYFYMYTPTAQTSSSTTLTGSADQTQGPNASHWQWSLGPQT